MSSSRLAVLALTLAPVVVRADAGSASPSSPGSPGSPSSWPSWDDAKLGIHVKHPPGAKVVFHAGPAGNNGTVEITGAKLPTITIEVSTTGDRETAKNGGVSGNHVEYTIDVPKRHARCASDAADADQADLAVEICDRVTLDPGARHPHVELQVDATGLADSDAFDRAVKGKQAAFDACWTAALKKDHDLPEGSFTIKRTYDHGAPAAARTSAENFFDHDAKALGACVTALVKAVPAKTSADAAEITVQAICQLY